MPGFAMGHVTNGPMSNNSTALCTKDQKITFTQEIRLKYCYLGPEEFLSPAHCAYRDFVAKLYINL